jgi:hypothetical protein
VSPKDGEHTKQLAEHGCLITAAEPPPLYVQAKRLATLLRARSRLGALAWRSPFPRLPVIWKRLCVRINSSSCLAHPCGVGLLLSPGTPMRPSSMIPLTAACKRFSGHYRGIREAFAAGIPISNDCRTLGLCGLAVQDRAETE